MKNTIYSFIAGCLAILWLYLAIPLLPQALWLIDLNTIAMNKSCLMHFSKNTCDMYVYGLVLLIPLPVYLAATSIYCLAISIIEYCLKFQFHLAALLAGLATTIMTPTMLDIALNRLNSHWLIQAITAIQFVIIFSLSLVASRFIVRKTLPPASHNHMQTNQS